MSEFVELIKRALERQERQEGQADEREQVRELSLEVYSRMTTPVIRQRSGRIVTRGAEPEIEKEGDGG
jgi:hypothetical protein